MLEVIQNAMISCYPNNFLAGHFTIKTIGNFFIQKYYLPVFCHNIEAYVNGPNVCLALKMVKHNLYSSYYQNSGSDKNNSLYV